MCLKYTDFRPRDYRIGYKVIRKYAEGEYGGDICGDIDKTRYAGKWLNSKDYCLYGDDQGWHFFRRTEACLHWGVESDQAIVKIRVSKIISTGDTYLDQLFSAGVCQKIKIIEEVGDENGIYDKPIRLEGKPEKKNG